FRSTFILWLGWFGFNGGSQLALGSAADVVSIATIYVNTNLAAAGGVLGAMALTQIMYKKIDLTMVLNGAIAGLVAITAEPLMPSPGVAILIGAVGGMLAVLAVPLLYRLRIDDVVGAIPAHLVAGIWGTLVVPLSNPDAAFATQLIGVVAIGAFTFVASLIVWSVLKSTIGIRIAEDDEMVGIDQIELGMEAYPEFGPSLAHCASALAERRSQLITCPGGPPPGHFALVETACPKMLTCTPTVARATGTAIIVPGNAQSTAGSAQRLRVPTPRPAPRGGRAGAGRGADRSLDRPADASRAGAADRNAARQRPSVGPLSAGHRHDRVSGGGRGLADPALPSAARHARSRAPHPALRGDQGGAVHGRPGGRARAQ